MTQSDMKELLKSKTMDELLELVILGLQNTDAEDSFISSFKDTDSNILTEEIA